MEEERAPKVTGCSERLVPVGFTILVVGFVAFSVGALFLAYLFYLTRNPSGTITVTGSAKERVKADVAVWSASFSVRTNEKQLSEAFRLMKQHEESVLKVFKEHAVAESEFTLSSVSVEREYDEGADPLNKPYSLVQYVFVETKDVDVIASKVKQITQDLLEKGIVFQAGPVEFYYSRLPELRVTLLSKAMEDARKRAEEIAKSAGSRLGKLVTARSGVVQVLAPNSADVSDYGTYDVRTLEKDVMVTVNVTYRIK